jgi:hypothetical protein
MFRKRFGVVWITLSSLKEVLVYLCSSENVPARALFLQQNNIQYDERM